MHSSSNLDGLHQQKTTMCQLRTGIWSYKRWEKMLFGLIQMVDLEFGVNNIKHGSIPPWISAFFTLVVVLWPIHPFSSAFLYQGCSVTAAYFPLHFGYSAQNLKLVSWAQEYLHSTRQKNEQGVTNEVVGECVLGFEGSFSESIPFVFQCVSNAFDGLVIYSYNRTMT